MNKKINKTDLLIIIFGIIFISVFAFSQKQNTDKSNYIYIHSGDSFSEIIKKAANVVPTKQQYEWQKLEFMAFIHFGMNTFYNQEWGKGTEDPSQFNPSDLDARQWVKVIKDAGMKMLILTAKHHDGFCLWPSKYTEHSVKNSPWKNGKGDVVKEAAGACHEMGIKFGVYLSPWDRHEKSYGDSPKYNEYFKNQLRELLTNYGEVAEVWFDGACAEGPNGKKQIYDFKSYYKVIRELQPEAVISIMGPDIRWVGTESGYGRETEWSVVPDILMNTDTIASKSQQNPVDGVFNPGDLTAEDLGGREKIKKAKCLVWYPAETDVSIRPGWFYHSEQDLSIKSPEVMTDIYYSSVGRNSLLLLNIPPDKSGKIHENDIKSLLGLKNILDQTFKNDFLLGAKVKSTNERKGFEAHKIIDNDPDSYWNTDEGVESAAIEFDLSGEYIFDRLLLQENILEGQRIEKFHADYWDGKTWKEFTRGTTVGYKRLLRFDPVRSNKIRLVIDQSRTSPTLSGCSLYKSPLKVSFKPEIPSFRNTLEIELKSDGDKGNIYYTLDGTKPDKNSILYSKPILLNTTTIIKAIVINEGEPSAEITQYQYIKSKSIEKIMFENKYNPKYSGSGDGTIINGRRGKSDCNDKEWLGYEGDDFSITIDLGKVTPVNKISAGFLQQQGAWVFLPDSIVYLVSDNGKKWKKVYEKLEPSKQTEQVLTRDFEFISQQVKTRFIKIYAKNVGICPKWHIGNGSKAWLFVDEIIIE